MNKTRVIIECAVLALFSFILFYVVMSTRLVASIILSLFIFAACLIRQYIKYKMIKEEEKYK